MPIHFYGVLPWGPTRHEVVPKLQDIQNRSVEDSFRHFSQLHDIFRLLSL